MYIFDPSNSRTNLCCTLIISKKKRAAHIIQNPMLPWHPSMMTVLKCLATTAQSVGLSSCQRLRFQLNPWIRPSHLFRFPFTQTLRVTHSAWVGCQVPQLYPGLIAWLAHLGHHFPLCEFRPQEHGRQDNCSWTAQTGQNDRHGERVHLHLYRGLAWALNLSLILSVSV